MTSLAVRLKDFLRESSAKQGLPLKHFKGDVQPDQDGEALEPFKLLTINGKPAAEFWGPGAAAPKAGNQLPKPLQKKPVPAAQFRGELVRVNYSEKRLSLRLRQSIVVQSPYHTWQIGHVQRKLLLDRQIKNPQKRLAYIQEHLLELAYHQAHLYRRHSQHQDLLVQAEPGVQVRSLQTPVLYDDKGNLRRPTAKELKELQGPDPKLPGYTAEFLSLKTGSVVDIYLARIDAARLPENFKDGGSAFALGAPLEAVVIVIQVAAP